MARTRPPTEQESLVNQDRDREKLTAARSRQRVVVISLAWVLGTVGVIIALIAIFGPGPTSERRPSENVAVPWQKQD